jgi:hypothetical protein
MAGYQIFYEELGSSSWDGSVAMAMDIDSCSK